MPIVIKEFGGLFPKLAAERLPDGGAQTASNVELRGGVISGIAVAKPFHSLHETTGKLTGNVPSAEQVTVAKPGKITTFTRTFICKPHGTGSGPDWFAIRSFFWWAYYAPGSGSWTVNELWSGSAGTGGEVTFNSNDVRYTPTGLVIRAAVPSPGGLSLISGTNNYFFGPTYQFIFYDDAANFGGPDIASTISYPTVPQHRDPKFTDFRQSLNYPSSGGTVYAHMQVADVSGPDWNEVVDAADASGPRSWPSTEAEFVISLNYLEPRQRSYRFCSAELTNLLQEGPPSDPSEIVVVQPGEIIGVALSTALAKRRLYRGGRSGELFKLVDEYDGYNWQSSAVAPPGLSPPADNLWIDPLVGDQDIEIPPFGNHDKAPGTPDAAAFFGGVGAFVHPANYAVSYVNTTGASHKHELRPSDLYRLYAWPDEYAIPFQQKIVAITLVGSTTLVFTRSIDSSGNMITTAGSEAGQVWAVNGGNPAYLSAVMISDTAPLLLHSDTLAFSLCRLGGRVFWSTIDGIAACDGNSVEIITRAHYDRTTWNTLTPKSFECKTADNGIFLRSISGGTNLFLNFDGDQLKAISTYTGNDTWAGNFGPERTWKSKKYQFDSPTCFPWARIIYTGAVTLSAWADGGSVFGGALTGSGLIDLGALSASFKTPALAWEFQTSGTGTVRSIEFYDRQTVAVDNVIRETCSHGQVPPNLIRRYEFKNRVRLRSLIVHTAPNTSVDMKMYLNGDTAAVVQNGITGGNEIRLTSTTLVSSLELDFQGNDHLVTEFIINGQPIVPIGDGPLTITDPTSWIGNLFKFPDRGTFACISAIAETYDSTATLSLYQDFGAAHYTDELALADKNLIYITRTKQTEAAIWELSATGPAKVHSVTLWPRTRVPVQGRTLHEVNNDTGVPRWAWARYEFDETVVITSVRVNATLINSSTPATGISMTLYPDGALSTTTNLGPLTSNIEWKLSTPLRCSALDFDFGGSEDYKVNEVWIFAREVFPVGPEGLNLVNPVKKLGHLFSFGGKPELAVAQVGLSAYSGTQPQLTLSRDGAAPESPVSFSNGLPFLITRGLGTATLWGADITTDFEPEKIILLPRSRQSAGPNIEIINNEPSLSPWLASRYEFKDQTELVSGIVKASSAVTLSLYKDGANGSTPANGFAIASGAEFWITNDGGTTPFGLTGALDFNFGGTNDPLVSEVMLFSQVAIPVGASGLIIRSADGRKNWRRLLLNFKDTGSWSVLRIVASTYSDLRLRLFDASSLSTALASETVTSSNEIKLTAQTPRRSWVLDIDNGSGAGFAGEVFELHLIPRQLQAFDGKSFVMRHASDPFSWLARRVFSSRIFELTCGRVLASSYPVDVYFYNSDGDIVMTKTVNDKNEFRLRQIRMERELSIDIVAAESVLIYEAEFASNMCHLGRK